MDELRRVATQLLERPPVAPTPVVELARRARRRKRNRRGITAGAIAVSIALVVATAFSLRADDTPRVDVSTGPMLIPADQSVSFVVGNTNAILALTTSTTADSRPGDAGTLVRVDPHSSQVVARTPLSGAPAQVALDTKYAWVTLFLGNAVAKIDLATNSVVATIPLRLPISACTNDCPDGTDFLPIAIAVGDNAVWVSTARGYVARIDPASDQVVALIKTEFDQTGSIAVTPDAVLVSQGNQPIARIDPGTNAVTEIPNPVDENHGFSQRGAVEGLMASATNPALGVWGTVWLGGSTAEGAIGVNPRTGNAITASMMTGSAVRGVTDRVWVQVGDKILTLDSNLTGQLTGPALHVPANAVVSIDATAAWWSSKGARALVRTDLKKPLAETRIDLNA